MKTILLPINGLRHYDFGQDLERLYRRAKGRLVSFAIDEDNPGEENAVMAFISSKRLGHVRTGKDRLTALSAIRQCQKKVLMGKVASVDRNNRVIWAEVEVADDFVPDLKPTPHILTDWTYDGPTLPRSTEQLLLQTQTAMLYELLSAHPQAWDMELEDCLCAIEEYGWTDISGDARDCREQCLRMMTALGNANEEFVGAASRLQYALDHMGSPESRHQLMEWMRQMAAGPEVHMLISELGPRARRYVTTLPRQLLERFALCPEEVIGRLWYLQCPAQVVEGVLTLLTLTLSEEYAALGEKEAAEKEKEKEKEVSPLFSPQAEALWQKAAEQQWVDANHQPLISAPRAAILASVMSDELKLNPRWNAFEKLWNISNLPNQLAKAQSSGYYLKFLKDVDSALLQKPLTNETGN